jgi:ferric-dicitrate binding protein FerR (iron transport regulator)
LDGSNQREADALAIKAYELFMATHLEPDNPKARAKLIAWVQESQAHWRAFLALDQYLAEVTQLLDAGPRGEARRH